MGEEKSKAAVEKIDESGVKQFDFGTIVLTCKCGRKQTLMEHVQYGIQFIVATNDQAGITLHCDECHSELRLSCEEGVAPSEPVEPEVKVDESKVDEQTPRAVIESIEIEENIPELIINENIPEENKEGKSL